MAERTGVSSWILLVIIGLMAASVLPVAAEEMIMLRGYPNIWVPKSKLIGEPQAALPHEQREPEEMIMLRGYPNIWVPKSKLE